MKEEYCIEGDVNIARQAEDIFKQHGDLVAIVFGNKHICVEGWQILAKFKNTEARITGVIEIEVGGVRGYEATAQAYRTTESGVVDIGISKSRCMGNEQMWSGKPEFHLQSMAQTRAIGKVLRTAYGYIMALTEYKTTPLEEMQGIDGESGPPKNNGSKGSDPKKNSTLTDKLTKERTCTIREIAVIIKGSVQEQFGNISEQEKAVKCGERFVLAAKKFGFKTTKDIKTPDQAREILGVLTGKE